MSLAGSTVDSHVARRAWQRGLLLLGLTWALVVVVPDFYRLSAPLATLGFLADNSGVIYEVNLPATAATPGSAVASGLRENDRIVLAPGACWHPTSARCRNYLAVFGGMGGLTYVLPGTVITLSVLPVGETKPIDVTVAARDEDLAPAAKVVLALDEVAAVVVLWLAFRLAWNAPGRMTIGFFLFAMWFNPGQYFVLYAWLQTHPVLLLVQEVLQAIAQGAGYAGFLVFALRFPHDRRAHRLRGVEGVAIFSGVVLALLQLASFLNVLGVPTEIITRAAILGGYAVAIAAFVVVRLRLRYQSPLDYQRMRWVLWGCAIGIPAFIFADSNEATSLWTRYVWNREIFGGWQPDESVFELAFLLSGILAIFISAAVRHRRIVNVTPELRAVAAAVLALVLGVVIEDRMHEPITAALTMLHVPESVQFYLAIVPLVICSAAVHRGSHAMDHLFNRGFYHAASVLDVAAATVARAVDELSVDGVLVHAPCLGLELASAAVFRETDSAFLCVVSNPERDAKLLGVDFPEQYAIIERLRKGEVVGLPMPLWAARDADDAMVPALAVPVIFDDRLYRVAVYGAHQTGAALDRLEVDLLVKFAARAAIGYERLEMRRLRARLGA